MDGFSWAALGQLPDLWGRAAPLSLAGITDGLQGLRLRTGCSITAHLSWAVEPWRRGSHTMARHSGVGPGPPGQLVVPTWP